MGNILALAVIFLCFFAPLFAYTAGKTGVKKRRYTLYIRAQASYAKPTDAAGWSALLATFTEIGSIEDKTLKVTCKPNDTIALNDGTKKALDYIGNIEAKHVNLTADNITEIASTYDNKDIDALLFDSTSQEAIVVQDFTSHFDEEWLSGDVSNQLFNGEKIVAAKSDFRDFFAVPQA